MAISPQKSEAANYHLREHYCIVTDTIRLQTIPLLQSKAVDGPATIFNPYFAKEEDTKVSNIYNIFYPK